MTWVLDISLVQKERNIV